MTGTWRRIGTGRSRGIALVIVLWGLVLLAVIAAAFTTETRTEVALARNLVENAKARALADAGVNAAMLGLHHREVEKRWRADGTIHSLALGAGKVRIVIEDEGGKIDLNTAPDELIQGLLTAVGLDEAKAVALTAAIADFRDADDEAHLGGGEADDYRAASLAWGPKNKPFEAVEELHQVLGMTRELYERVAPALTVYSRQRGINPVTAPREVLAALPGVDADQVEALRAALAPMGEVVDPSRLPVASGVGRYFVRRKANVYTVRSEAQTTSGTVFIREAVVYLTRNIERPFRTYAWRRGRLPLQTIGTGYDVPDIALAPAAGPAAPTARPAPKKAPPTTAAGVTLKIRPPTATRGDGGETPAMEPPSVERPPLITVGREADAPATTIAPAAGTPAPGRTAMATLRKAGPPPAPPVSSPAPAARPIARLPSPAAKARRAPSASPPVVAEAEKRLAEARAGWEQEAAKQLSAAKGDWRAEAEKRLAEARAGWEQEAETRLAAATVKKQVTKKQPTKKTPTRADAAPAGYRVQLGAFESERIARREMARIVRANRDLLGDLGVAVRRADLGAKGVFYRVRTGPLAARKEARTLCASLSERKVPCFVVSAGKQ